MNTHRTTESPSGKLDMENSTEREPTLYGMIDQEILTASCIEEAVEEYAESIYPDKPEKTLLIQGYAPRQISSHYFSRALDYLLEEIDEEYGDPEDGPARLPDNVEKLWDAFVEGMKNDYHIWSCESVGNPIDVDTAEYWQEPPPL